MKMHVRLFASALLVTFALALGAAGAYANGAIESEGGTTASGRITFAGTELSETRITCDVTLLRSVERYIRKTGGAFGKVVGIAITRGESRSERSPACTHGAAIREVRDIIPLREARSSGTHRELGGGVLLYDITGGRGELWREVYDSFQGTLPEITGVNFHIQEAQFKLSLTELFGATVECLYKGNVFGLVRIERGTARTASIVLERTLLERQEGSAFCPARGTISGELAISPNLRVRLVARGGPIVTRIRAGAINIPAGMASATERFMNTTQVGLEDVRLVAYGSEAKYRVEREETCVRIRPQQQECELRISRIGAAMGAGEIALRYRWEGREFFEEFAVFGE